MKWAVRREDNAMIASHGGQVITYSCSGGFCEYALSKLNHHVMKGKVAVYVFEAEDEEVFFFSNKPISLALLRQAFKDEAFTFNE
jgi:hypothetical protein